MVLCEGHGLWNLLDLHLSPCESLGNRLTSLSLFPKLQNRNGPWQGCCEHQLSSTTLGPVPDS